MATSATLQLQVALPDGAVWIAMTSLGELGYQDLAVPLPPSTTQVGVAVVAQANVCPQPGYDISVSTIVAQ